MADNDNLTTVLSGLELTKWRKRFIREYVRDSGFEPYMSVSPNSIIHVVNDLQTNGYTIRVPLIKSLKGVGVKGNERLSGKEEKLDQYYQDIAWDYYRNAIEISKKERGKSAVDIAGVRYPLLRDWAAELIKYDLIAQFHAINGAPYSAASLEARNAWMEANKDRILFGNDVSSLAKASGNHASALKSIAKGSDKLSPALISKAKRLAKVARPRIRPYRTGTQGREYFVLFCDPLCFRDLKNSDAMQQANREARPRDVENNPIFQDGDLIYDGVIAREIPEFQSPRFEADEINQETHLKNVGTGNTDVGVNFLCGAQAIGFVNKQAPMPTSKNENDYRFFDGSGVELAHGIEKLTWNNGDGTRKDVGIFTIYAAASADS
ncbi:MAG: DUF4043 family protein [Hyphomicrobiaceae bacterium]